MPSPVFYRVHSFNSGGGDSAGSSGKGGSPDAIEKWSALAYKGEFGVGGGGGGGGASARSSGRGGGVSVGSPGLQPSEVASMVTPKVRGQRPLSEPHLIYIYVYIYVISSPIFAICMYTCYIEPLFIPM